MTIDFGELEACVSAKLEQASGQIATIAIVENLTIPYFQLLAQMARCAHLAPLGRHLDPISIQISI
ncbi:MAG: hypothetical protein A2289_11685 [Deltaproteobacteria bacterium RIFOXYA12_FULL_58_15]|nr:MAG: hypothetical protein A2289_11685 [Deltaproteobacteria bacterium RIFOXYA12_FULL_58_15]